MFTSKCNVSFNFQTFLVLDFYSVFVKLVLFRGVQWIFLIVTLFPCYCQSTKVRSALHFGH